MTQIINKDRIVIASCIHHGFEQENSLGSNDGLDPRVKSGMEFALLALELRKLGLPEPRRLEPNPHRLRRGLDT